MKRMKGKSFLATVLMVFMATGTLGQGQRGGAGARGGGAPGAAAAVGGRGNVAPVPGPKALIADAKPARSCESLASVALPNTTIESATVDANNPGISAASRRSPRILLREDRVRIWVAIPISNWNGRFLGNGGGGFSGGNAAAITRRSGLRRGCDRHRS